MICIYSKQLLATFIFNLREKMLKNGKRNIILDKKSLTPLPLTQYEKDKDQR